MPFEMNMLIMYHVQHLSTKTHLKLLTKLLPYSKYRMSNMMGKIIQFSAVVKKGHIHNLSQIQKEAVGFPVICHLVARKFT